MEILTGHVSAESAGHVSAESIAGYVSVVVVVVVVVTVVVVVVVRVVALVVVVVLIDVLVVVLVVILVVDEFNMQQQEKQDSHVFLSCFNHDDTFDWVRPYHYALSFLGLQDVMCEVKSSFFVSCHPLVPCGCEKPMTIWFADASRWNLS